MNKLPERPRRFRWGLLIPVFLVVAFFLGYMLGKQPGSTPQPAPEALEAHEHGLHEPAEMVSPEAARMESPRRFVTTPEARALMGIQTSPVERRSVTAEVRMVGKVDFDETRQAYITAWIPGRLDKLYVDFTGVRVNKGDPMVYLYSPELLSAQEELLQAIRASNEIKASDVGILREATQATVEAAREKLRLWGLTREQIEEIEKTRVPSDHMVIHAPIGGIVITKDSLQGMYVEAGTTIYTIADLDQVWVKLDAYESDLVWLQPGQEVGVTSEAYPGEVFMGKIAFIDPVLNDETRTVKVRVNMPNPEGKLKPAMFVHGVARVAAAQGGSVAALEPVAGHEGPHASDPVKPLVIPASAALITGTRAIVYVAVPDARMPTYEGREILLGPRVGDYYIVRTGLQEGELVVTNGNFKIDSALQILAKPSMMSPEGGGAAAVHAHGEMPATTTQAMQVRVEVPRQFLEELRPVLVAHDELREISRSEDLPKIRAAFAKLGDSVSAVDMTLLSGHAHMIWMELSAFLTNDAVEGHEARDLKEARRVLAGLTKNIERLREQFPGAGKLGEGPPPQTSPPAGGHRHE